MSSKASLRMALFAVVSLGLLAAAGLAGARPVAADGIGVYPTDIRLEESLRGSEYFYTIGVINGANAERSYRFLVKGDAGQWISFVAPEDRTKVLDGLVVKAQSEGQVVLRLSVPNDAANGQYEAIATVVTAVDPGESSSGASSSITLGVDIVMRVNVVGTQKIEGALVEVVAADTEVGYPLQIRTTIRNSGNVQVKPEIEAKVLGSPTVLLTGKVTDESVQPNETKTIVAQLDTSRLTPGKYVTQVSVNFAGIDLGSRELTFTALPRGTLTRQGVLDALVLMNDPVPGSVAKVNAIFRNTGQIDSRAVFVGEFFRNGVLIKAITGVEKFVSKGERSILEIFLDVPGKGTYTLRGKVNFEGKESEGRELTFQVGTESSGMPVWVWIATGAGLAVIAGGTAAGARSRLRRRA